MVVYVFSAKSQQRNKKQAQKGLQQDLKTIYLKLQGSLLSPFREVKNTPIPNNITETSKDAMEISQLNLPLINGWTTAKIITATPKLINPLPSSRIPLNKSMQSL